MATVLNYVEVQDSIQTPTDSFVVSRGLDSGNNTGWLFGINVQYLSIQDSNATPPQYFIATNSIDVSDNTGWFINGTITTSATNRLAEAGAIAYGQISSALPNKVSRLGGAGQIEADIVKIKADGVYTTRVSGLTVRGRLINKALGY